MKREGRAHIRRALIRRNSPQPVSFVVSDTSFLLWHFFSSPNLYLISGDFKSYQKSYIIYS